MHYILGLITLGASASAIQTSNQNSQCKFPMTAIFSTDGPVMNAAIGENRIGGGYLRGDYTISPPSLSDSQGHNCIVDPSSSRFYCSQYTRGNANFGVDEDGNLMHNGTSKWLACPVTGPDADGSFDIYTSSKANTTGCEDITIKTYVHDSWPRGYDTDYQLSSGDAACQVLACPQSVTSHPTKTQSISAVAVSPTAPVPVSTSPTSTALDASCPTDISSGEYRFPLLILPVSPETPDYAYGNSYVAYVSPDNTTVFNFDIPEEEPYTGTCALLFLFPYASQLGIENSPFYFSGLEEEEGENGGLDFALLTGVADPELTYKTTPSIDTDYGKTEVVPGNSYTIATFPCKSGEASYSVSSVGNVELDFFQDSEPDPIGLYIVPCSS